MTLRKVLLLKYGEIALKGLNRSSFEQILKSNIKKALDAHGYGSGNFIIEKEQSTMMISRADNKNDENFDIDRIIPVVNKVFGIAAVNSAVETEKDMDAIKEAVREYVLPLLDGKKSFAVGAKRSDKSFPLKSPDIASEIGDMLYKLHTERTKSTANGANSGNINNIIVDLSNPEIKVTIEIRGNGAYVHTVKHKGAGGVPVGSNGNGLLLLSGGIDSPVAGYMMARRGMRVSALHFTSEPYTSPRSKEKVMRLAKILSDYCGHIKFYTISVTDIQEKIREKCSWDYLTIILRHCMMKLAEEIAGKNHLQCIITGESLGQVASQTMEAINATNYGVKYPVFRPCIGLDKQQIVEIAQQIGTYETSIEPYEDCCTVFTPRHPVTKPKLYKVFEEEQKLGDMDLLISEAYKTLIVED